MSGFARVTKPIELISLVGCTIYLEQFTVHSKNVSLENCVIYGESQLFTCESLQLSVSGFQNLDWIDDSKCKNISLAVNQFDQEFYYQLKYLSKYQSLKRVNISDSTIDLSQMNITLPMLVFRRCELQNLATTQMKMEELNIYDSQLKSSQLKNSNISKMYLQNYFDGEDFSFYYYGTPLKTIIDDLPNVDQLNMSECILKLCTFSVPKINKFEYYGNRSQLISLKFFENIQQIKINNEPDFLKEYKNQQQKHKNISSSQLGIIENQSQMQKLHKELIDYARTYLKNAIKVLQMVYNGVE
ncbi:Hypothetical_protein [Hexamita inflata]|uniref:Hypothetical_protein n=1 Tax=Hexamita inflata TaxID=28002 RepID=A0AA86Q0L1_9EUKA|nr:Hypothetical protein HINF_LOCUS30789 [Hexamita inflata]